MLNNSINSVWEQAGGLLVKPQFISGLFSNIASGDVDLYTVPSGRAAIFTNGGGIFNSTAGSITAFSQIKVSGTYYRTGRDVVNSAGNSGNLITLLSVLNAGESFAINTTALGINLAIGIIEFDPSSPLKTYRVLTLSNGDNTIMTVPSGKMSKMLATNLDDTANGVINYFNDSGASRNVIGYGVLNGGSIGSGSQRNISLPVSDNQESNYSTGISTLKAGDFVALNTNSGTATQSAFVSVIELPA